MGMLKKVLMSLMILSVASFAFAGGQGEAQTGGDMGGQAADEGAAMEEKGEVEIAYVDGWARGVAITHVAAEVLMRMGYEVSATPVANAAMWAALAEGDVDFQMTAWLPATHAAYYGPEGQYTDDVVMINSTYDSAALGLIVPQYVDVDSIPELVEKGDMFDFEITGIDPGAGMMQQTETAIDNDVSGLGAYTLLEGSGATMLAALDDAYQQEEPIVVTLWAPHWAFGRWDLKLLDDPDNIYGEAEQIYNMGRMGLEEDMPEVYRFLEETDWKSLDFGPVMVNNEAEGMDYFESAKLYVDNNLDAINAALPSDMQIQ